MCQLSGKYGAAYKKCPKYLAHKETIDRQNKTNEQIWTERRQDPAHHRKALKIQPLMTIKDFPLLVKQTDMAPPQTTNYQDRPQPTFITIDQLQRRTS